MEGSVVCVLDFSRNKGKHDKCVEERGAFGHALGVGICGALIRSAGIGVSQSDNQEHPPAPSRLGNLTFGTPKLGQGHAARISRGGKMRN